MTKKPKFQAPTGMHDILPEDQKYFQKIYDVTKNIADFYGFKKIDTPMVEEAELFSRGVGLSTDIVQKEMYTFKTKGGDFLALRPEGTAPVVRAFIEQGMQALSQPVKLWYFGPFFRHEKPQSGRFRQFWQFGFEVLGEKSPVIDIQIIQIFYNILRELKLKNLTIGVNSIGDNQCRPYYKKLLVSYFKERGNALCLSCQKRLKENPLRILDCKQEKCQRIVSQAPQMLDHLCEDCHNHFKEVLEFLDEIDLPYQLNPYLVRGLDFYTKTVFEIFSEEEPLGEDLKNALVGGGRYDALIKLLGGPDTPACGAAAGVDRMAVLIKTKTPLSITASARPKIFLAQLGNLGKRKSLKLFEEFRKAKIPIAESLSKDSLRAQLSRAHKIEADFVLILGQKEALDNQIIVRDMKTGKQQTFPLEKIVTKMRKKIKND